MALTNFNCVLSETKESEPSLLLRADAPEEEKNDMKKLSALMLGAAMVLSTAAFAASKSDNKPATETPKTAKKHHSKKSKKSAKGAAAMSAKPATTPAPTK